LTYSEVSVGTTTITVTANDGNGGTVSDDFTITINDVVVNNPPTVANAIADKAEDEGFTSNTVDLANVFADADSDALTFPAISSAEGEATVAVSVRTLTYSEVSVGTTTITVTANDDNGGTITDDFTLTINAVAVNNAPTVANAITDQTAIEGFRLLTIDLINVFTDVDEDALLFTAVSSNTSIASVNVSGFNLDISEEATGTVTITVTADDGRGGIATDEFSLSILEAAVPQEAEIPQGFSPNGDGVNDMWQVPNIENFPNNTVTIFDRQGNKVYQARGYNNADVSFEGLASSGAINKSQGLADGVYYYIIDLGNGESRKGHIIIKQ
jgi:gliding motility-associated-like protein